MTTTHSGDTSPGGSNSLSNSSSMVRTRMSGAGGGGGSGIGGATEEGSHQAVPHKSFDLNCYNSSSDRDDESDQCDEDALSQLMLQSDLFRPMSSIGVQTDYNEDFPPLKFLRALGEDLSMVGAHPPPFFFNAAGGALSSEMPGVVPHQNPQLSAIPSLSAAAVSASGGGAADATSSTSSDGMLQLVIQNFRHMSDTVRGPCKYIQNVPWRIMVMPRQHVVQKKGTQKCLGFFLQCCPDAYSESWSCQASAELRLISQKPGVPNFTRKTNHVYTAKENDWGYSCFMTWADILDEAQGYIKDDKVTLEVSVKADPPKNILTHKEFQKKIQDYKRLADIQCQRGLIDKAIECNTQALKFCKDKDPECKAELDAQKAHLIEMKLKQSIQRIEKGGDGAKVEDDSVTNLNALRQALGATTRSNANNSSKTAATKNKSTSTKDKETAQQQQNNNNMTATEKQQQQNQRAGTPPYTTQQHKTGTDQQQQAKNNNEMAKATRAMKTMSKSVEPPQINQKTKTTTTSSTVSTSTTNSSSGAVSGKENSPSSVTEQHQQCKKKRLYKSASSTEMLSAATADDFDFSKERYLEEEELLPSQIQHFLKHLSEGGKSSTRLKDQIAKLEMIASPFEKPDPFLEELMKIDPKDADKALVKAITFAALERENGREYERMNDSSGSQMEKRLSKVIRNKICESCLKEGHFQIEKRETSESGCQTEFARRIPREIHADGATLRMMQQLQQQQQLIGGGQPTAEDYMNALNNQAAFAAAAAAQQQQQQQQNQMNATMNNSSAAAMPTRRKKAAAKKNNAQQQNLFQQQQPQMPQFIPKANTGSNRLQSSDGSQTATMMNHPMAGLDLNDPRMDMFGAAAKPFMGTPGIVENLSALADLDLTKIQFPSDQTITDPSQVGAGTNNIFSRQYIEEWFRYSARNVLKLNYGGGDQQKGQTTEGTAGQQQETQQQLYQSSIAGGSSSITEQEMQLGEATAALGVIQLNCLNARNIQQKITEFVESLESHPNFRDLRSSIERLLTLSADDENYTNPEDTVSVVSVSECSGRDLDLNKDSSISHDFSNIQRLFLEDDPHDYMLLRELKQAEMVLATRLNSIMYQMHQASIADIVDRIELKMKALEEKLKTSKTECGMMRANEKKNAEQLGQLQKELQNLNGKYEKLIQQLKDRKNEIKKLEKKAKSEAQLATENTELHEKVDTLKRELAQAQKQLSEEQAKYKRDTQSLADSKKHLSVELNSKYAEVQKMSSQLDEKGQALKKSEQQLANERKNSSQTISNLQERVKRAEVNLLEHKLDDGLRVLERAREDCAQQIKHLEEQRQKRSSPSDLDIIKKNIAEWEIKREEVAALISQAKTDFNGHIQSIKNGKQLSQLPKIQVPKPPPGPKITPLPTLPSQTSPAASSTILHQSNGSAQQQQQVPPSPLPMERKVITPPSTVRTRIGATTPQQLSQIGQQQPPTPNLVPVGGVPTGRQSIPSSATVTPVKFQSQQPSGQQPQVSSVVGQQQQQQTPIAPIGVRPHNYQNGISMPPPPVAQQQNQQKRHSPQLGVGGSIGQFHAGPVPPHMQQFHMSNPPPTAAAPGVAPGHQQTWGGSGWGDHQLNNISELFGQGRSFGPLGSDFGGSGGSAIGGMRSASVIHPPAAGVIGSGTGANNAGGVNPPSSQPIGAGRSMQNASPSQQQNQQQRNGWSSFTADTWNAPLSSGRQN